MPAEAPKKELIGSLKASLGKVMDIRDQVESRVQELKKTAEERIKGDFDGAIDLLVEEGRVRVVRSQMEPVFRRTLDGGRKEVKPLVVLLTLRPLPDELQSPEYKEVAKSAERVVKVLRLERRPSP